MLAGWGGGVGQHQALVHAGWLMWWCGTALLLVPGPCSLAGVVVSDNTITGSLCMLAGWSGGVGQRY